MPYPTVLRPLLSTVIPIHSTVPSIPSSGPSGGRPASTPPAAASPLPCALAAKKGIEERKIDT